MSRENEKLTLFFPEDKYTPKMLWMIIRKAEEWDVSPSEAEARILNEAAQGEELETAV